MGKSSQNPDEHNGEKKTPRTITRRCFLGTVGALSTTALIGTGSKASAAGNFEGWPNRLGVLTDLTACVGCRSCEKACNEANNLPQPDKPFDDASVFDETRRTSAHAFTVVNRY